MKRWIVASLLVALAACDSDAEKPCADEQGIACIWAGTGKPGYDGDEKDLRESRLYWPIDVAFTNSGTYVLDWNNHKVREVLDDNTFETVIGTDFVGDGDSAKADLVQPGVEGTTVALNHPTQLLELVDGGLMLIAWHNHKLRHFDPATGLVYVACGRKAGLAGDGAALGPDTLLNQPAAGAVAPDGSVYLLDQRNQRIRKIDPGTNVITTVVADRLDAMDKPMAGFEGDGGDPLDALVNFPTGPNPQPNGGMAVDAQGRLYFADTLNQRIRVVDFAANTIDTLAGTGTAGSAGDGGPATAAQINNPRDVQIGPDGKLYFADELNHKIRAIDLESGVIDTVMGTGKAGTGEDGLDPTDTALSRPAGISFDDDSLYVADTDNHVIRRLPLTGVN